LKKVLLTTIKATLLPYQDRLNHPTNRKVQLTIQEQSNSRKIEKLQKVFDHPESRVVTWIRKPFHNLVNSCIVHQSRFTHKILSIFTLSSY